MKTLQPVNFGSLNVGDLFRIEATATGIDQKIEPRGNSNGRPYSCGCQNAAFNTAIGVDDSPILRHVCDSRTVWVEVEGADDPALITDAPVEAVQL